MKELVDMKVDRSKINAGASEPAMAEGPEYPYGLRLRLETEDLKKLGLTELPDIGAGMMLVAEAKVCACSQSKALYGEQRSLELQVIAMKVKPSSKGDKAEGAYES